MLESLYLGFTYSDLRVSTDRYVYVGQILALNFVVKRSSALSVSIREFSIGRPIRLFGRRSINERRRMGSTQAYAPSQ